MATFEYKLKTGHLYCDYEKIEEGQVMDFPLVDQPTVTDWLPSIRATLEEVISVVPSGNYLFSYDESLLGGFELNKCNFSGLPTCVTCCDILGEENESLRNELESLKQRVESLDSNEDGIFTLEDIGSSSPSGSLFVSDGEGGVISRSGFYNTLPEINVGSPIISDESGSNLSYFWNGTEYLPISGQVAQIHVESSSGATSSTGAATQAFSTSFTPKFPNSTLRVRGSGILQEIENANSAVSAQAHLRRIAGVLESTSININNVTSPSEVLDVASSFDVETYTDVNGDSPIDFNLAVELNVLNGSGEAKIITPQITITEITK